MQQVARMSAAICGVPAVTLAPDIATLIRATLADATGLGFAPRGAANSPVAPNGCTMVVFFLKPTAVLKKALMIHTSGAA